MAEATHLMATKKHRKMRRVREQDISFLEHALSDLLPPTSPYFHHLAVMSPYYESIKDLVH
jgi:hypothetical protein